MPTLTYLFVHLPPYMTDISPGDLSLSETVTCSGCESGYTFLIIVCRRSRIACLDYMHSFEQSEIQ